MPIKTITPDRDGWYFAIPLGMPELAENLQLVLLERGRVWIVGNKVDEWSEDWRFYVGPVGPPVLDPAAADESAEQAGRSLVVFDTYPVPRRTEV